MEDPEYTKRCTPSTPSAPADRRLRLLLGEPPNQTRGTLEHSRTTTRPRKNLSGSNHDIFGIGSYRTKILSKRPPLHSSSSPPAFFRRSPDGSNRHASRGITDEEVSRISTIDAGSLQRVRELDVRTHPPASPALPRGLRSDGTPLSSYLSANTGSVPAQSLRADGGPVRCSSSLTGRFPQ